MLILPPLRTATPPSAARSATWGARSRPPLWRARANAGGGGGWGGAEGSRRATGRAGPRRDGRGTLRLAGGTPGRLYLAPGGRPAAVHRGQPAVGGADERVPRRSRSGATAAAG